MRTRKTGMRCWEMNWKRIGEFGDEEDSGWGCGQGPSGCNGDIGKRGIGSGNAQDDGRNDRLDGIADEWTGGGLESCLQSTRTLLVGGHVPQTSGGRRTL